MSIGSHPFTGAETRMRWADIPIEPDGWTLPYTNISIELDGWTLPYCKCLGDEADETRSVKVGEKKANDEEKEEATFVKVEQKTHDEDESTNFMIVTSLTGYSTMYMMSLKRRALQSYTFDNDDIDSVVCEYIDDSMRADIYNTDVSLQQHLSFVSFWTDHINCRWRKYIVNSRSDQAAVQCGIYRALWNFVIQEYNFRVIVNESAKVYNQKVRLSNKPIGAMRTMNIFFIYENGVPSTHDLIATIYASLIEYMSYASMPEYGGFYSSKSYITVQLQESDFMKSDLLVVENIHHYDGSNPDNERKLTRIPLNQGHLQQLTTIKYILVQRVIHMEDLIKPECLLETKKDWWDHMEIQMRGSLHTHILCWFLPLETTTYYVPLYDIPKETIDRRLSQKVIQYVSAYAHVQGRAEYASDADSDHD